MQSYTTQAHQRNYHGNVILPTKPTVKHRHSGIAIFILTITVAVSTMMLGIMTLHNHQLKQKLYTLEAHANVVTAPTAEQTLRRGKTLRRVPISEQEHNTENLPAVN